MSPRWILCALTSAALGGSALPAEPESVTVIKLSVQPMAAPKPALKYLLLPELRDMQTGNPIAAYLKCFMEQNQFYHGKESTADREKWLSCPLVDLPPGTENYGGVSLRQADYAARLDTPDWQLLHQLRTHGVSLLLPDIQQLRMLGSALKVRYRGQVKALKFNDAVRSHQTLFALARHLGEHPTLIGNLVGLAIANLAIGPFEEMLQQPGCPNLYWALADLPRPFIDLRKGLQGERIFIMAEFGTLLDATRVWDEEDLRAMREKLRQFHGVMGANADQKGDEEKLVTWLKDRLKDEPWLAEARQRLGAAGLPEAKVKRYPPEQVLFHDLVTKHEIARDEEMKWAGAPFWRADEAMLKALKPPANATPDAMIVASILPAIHRVRRSQIRMDQRLALLQVVEAVRMHAAANNGKWPLSLKDVDVPVPNDPVNGLPFLYKTENLTATIQGAPPRGEEKNNTFNIRYELTIRK